MRTLKLTTLLLAMSLVFGSISSCKYEDGPGISLRTKKSRLAGDWIVEKTIDADGTEGDGSDELGFLTFDKDGTGAVVSTDPSFSINFPFTWEFTDSKKKIKQTFDFLGSKEVTESTILRLTNKELWLKDEDGDQTNFKAK